MCAAPRGVQRSGPSSIATSLLVRLRERDPGAWGGLLTLFGPIVYRAHDHQSTMGAYVGQLSSKGGKGSMVNWRFADGANFLPSFEEVKALRKE